MEYRGSYPIFDPSGVRTYPLSRRPNKVELGNQVDCAALAASDPLEPAGRWFRNGAAPDGPLSEGLAELAREVAACRRAGRPVVVVSGAHPIKNGEISIVIDLIRRGVVTLYSANVAATIHSFELALTGASSESVRDALPTGDFGMAFETGHYLNCAIEIASERGWGFGEGVARLFGDGDFRRAVIDRALSRHGDDGTALKPYDGFPYAEQCVFAATHAAGIPTCVHASIGTDIIDQHASFSPAAKGATSGADFLVFAEHMTRLTEGGVILSIGSAIMAPEVILKAVSMAANVGRAPKDIRTAVFDVRPFSFDDAVRDESRAYYYLRDQKSLATRIPKVFGGVGYYFEGLHRQTLPAFYQHVVRALGPAGAEI
jgi:hypothetical protein